MKGWVPRLGTGSGGGLVFKQVLRRRCLWCAFWHLVGLYLLDICVFLFVFRYWFDHQWAKEMKPHATIPTLWSLGLSITTIVSTQYNAMCFSVTSCTVPQCYRPLVIKPIYGNYMLQACTLPLVSLWQLYMLQDMYTTPSKPLATVCYGHVHYA